MPDDLKKRIEQAGNRLDLTEYEIAAYLAVLEYGELSASEVSYRTDVPQPRVYDIVRRLEERSLVELIEGRPMRVRALDPAELFDDLNSSLKSLAADLGSRYTAPEPDDEAVSLVTSRQTILRRFQAIIEAAEYELILSLTPSLLKRFEKPLMAHRQANVPIELLVSPASEAPDPTIYDYLSVATRVRLRRGVTTPLLAVADGKHSIYTTQDVLKREQDQYGVIFHRSMLGFLVTGFFNTGLWVTADPLASDGNENGFPKQFASVRRCVKDLQQRDGEFHATVTGRTVETGRRWSESGTITDISAKLSERIVSFTLETEPESESFTIGGRVASLEDIEAHTIRINRKEPSEAD